MCQSDLQTTRTEFPRTRFWKKLTIGISRSKNVNCGYYSLHKRILWRIWSYVKTKPALISCRIRSQICAILIFVFTTWVIWPLSGEWMTSQPPETVFDSCHRSHFLFQWMFKHREKWRRENWNRTDFKEKRMSD